MSERGYDSDAQYLATPKHSDRMERSPTGRPFRRLELSEVLEQRPELLDPVFRAAVFNDIPERESGLPFGLCYIPTLQGSLSGARTASHTSNTAYNNGARLATSPGEEAITVSAEMQPAATNSLDTLTIITPNSAASILEPLPTIETPAGINSQTLMADWMQFLRTNRQIRGTTSSASLSDHGPDLVVPKRRESYPSDQSMVENRPLHLDELRISHVLAPRSISSGTHSGNASITAGRTNTNMDALLVADESRLRQKTATSTVSGTDPQKLIAIHRRDASSFYSRQSSPLSTEALKTRAANPTGSKSEIQVDRISQGGKPESITKSKFVEQFRPVTNDSESSRSPIDELESSPRQVSIGWMTNGRRVGYGYTMVSKAEEAVPANDTLLQTLESIERPPLMNADDENTKSTETGCSTAIDPTSEEPKVLIPLEKPIIIVDRRFPANDPAEGPEEVNDTTESIQEDHSWWKKLKSRPVSIQPRPRKAKEDVHHGRKTWVLGRVQDCSILEELSEHPQVEGSKANTPTLPFGPPDSIPHGYIPSPPVLSRNGRWSWRVSKYKETKRETKRLTNGRQENSDASSGPSFHDCTSTGLGRASSTRSNAEDLASMYQEECFGSMPGAFEGSSWARRV